MITVIRYKGVWNHRSLCRGGTKAKLDVDMTALLTYSAAWGVLQGTFQNSLHRPDSKHCKG